MRTEQLRSQLSGRIYHPTVHEVFEEYVGKYGCLDHFCEIIDRMPQEVAQTIIEVQSTQVYKEKSLWPIYISEKVGLDALKATKIGPVIDILWGLSTIIDDIIDHDQVRGDKPAAWVTLGTKKAQEFAFIALGASLDYLAEKVDPKSAKLATQFIARGINSTIRLKNMDINTDTSLILNNYLNRDDFHSAFPIHALYDPTIINRQALDNICLGLRLINQAGQLINDTRDILPNGEGTSRLSDFREGQVTVALKCLYSNLAQEDKAFFIEMFGSNSIDSYTNEKIGSMINAGSFRMQMKRRIDDTYTRGFNMLKNFMSERGVEILEDWIEYKVGILSDL